MLKIVVPVTVVAVLTDWYVCCDGMLLPSRLHKSRFLMHCLHQPATNWEEYWAMGGTEWVRWVLSPFYQRADGTGAFGK